MKHLNYFFLFFFLPPLWLEAEVPLPPFFPPFFPFFPFFSFGGSSGSSSSKPKTRIMTVFTLYCIPPPPFTVPTGCSHHYNCYTVTLYVIPYRLRLVPISHTIPHDPMPFPILSHVSLYFHTISDDPTPFPIALHHSL